MFQTFLNKMKNKPFFSIIICCYNSEKFLKQTLKSVENQSFKDWELIIIDDGSKDSTFEIINNFKNSYLNNKIKYFFQQNKGYASARNKGIEISNGEWICLLDHDDLMKCNRLEVQFKNINQNKKCKLFSSNSEHIDQDGNFIRNQYSVFNPLNIKDSNENFGIKLLKYGCFIGTETAIFKKDITKEIGKLDLNYKFISDYDFFIRIGLSYEFFISNEILSSHRIHIYNTQHKFFQSGIGYLEYSKLYSNYLFKKRITLKNRFVILKRFFLYLFYWFARKILNIRGIKKFYDKIKKLT